MKLFWFLMIGILISCGPKSRVIKKKKRVYGEKSVGLPLSLIVSQYDCEPKGAGADFHQVSIFRRGERALLPADYAKVSEKALKLEFAGEFHGGNQLSLLNQPKVIRKAISFSPCASTQDFEDNSYQDATLSILAPIKRYENNFPKMVDYLNLEPVKIRTAPLLKQGNKYLINNAFYYSGTKEITFLPQGYRDADDTKLPFQGKPFWKFPMVALHEYGHHVFSQLRMRAASKKGADTPVNLPPSAHQADLCFDNSHIHSSKSQFSGRVDRKVSKLTALTVVNEAFADIFAYFVEPAGRGLIGMGCLERSRDVEFAFFLSGERKAITKDVIEQFLNSEEIKYASCSIETDFQDAHLIGAIFARAIYRSLAFKPMSDDERLQILIQWIEDFTENSLSMKNPEEILRMAVHSYFEIFQSHLEVGQIECINYYGHFTGLTENRCF